MIRVFLLSQNESHPNKDKSENCEDIHFDVCVSNPQSFNVQA
jgi:hypothetical protein